MLYRFKYRDGAKGKFEGSLRKEVIKNRAKCMHDFTL
jgi:hypothetical protein